MRYYVYRRGYNTANNPSRGGGPETVMVAEVEADDADHARQLALDAGVTCYNNQGIFAEEADQVDVEESAKQAEIKKRVKLV